MKNRFYSASILLLLIGLIGTACSTASKSVDMGDYDPALERTLRKIAGKKNIRTDDVQIIEEAFNKATARDMASADRLKRDGQEENWPQVYEVYRKIQQRQDRLTPFLPLVSKDGVKANFKFVKVEEMQREAKELTAEYYYSSAQELLDRSRKGDRLAAREAYELLGKIDRYYQDYKSKIDLKEQAIELGTTYIIVEVENRAPVALPKLLEDELLRLDEGDLTSSWKIFHTQKGRGIEYDYRAVVQLVEMAVSPSSVKEREYELKATVEDGFEYVLDDNGNVKKDTSGNDVKVPKKVEIYATVFESYQSKAANIVGQLQFLELRTGTQIDRNELVADALFENYASTFQGDERALDEDAKKRIGNRPMPFPSDEAMLLEAGRELKNAIEQNIRNNRRIE